MNAAQVIPGRGAIIIQIKNIQGFERNAIELYYEKNSLDYHTIYPYISTACLIHIFFDFVMFTISNGTYLFV